MSDLKADFIYWYFNEFQTGELYTNLVELAEGSPWHRERSIAVHTDMVVSQYLSRSLSNWDENDLCGAFAAVFHDVGKPGAMLMKHREDRGMYKAFHGHELLSARMWEDWAVTNWALLQTMGMGTHEIYKVGVMIEYHLPWGLKNKEKMDNLAMTMVKADIDRPFVHLLLSDTYGRISDDAAQKRANANAWCFEFESRCAAVVGHPIVSYAKHMKGAPVLRVLVGASGSGKTTARDKFTDSLMYSHDDIRIELYGEPYADAWQKSTEDKHFNTITKDRYRNMLRTGIDVVFDLAITSKKKRRFWLTEARNRGYRLEAYLLPVSLQTVVERQILRDDKNVPPQAVLRQYNSLNLPLYGEFDYIYVIDSNL